jgi:hypothetical protein
MAVSMMWVKLNPIYGGVCSFWIFVNVNIQMTSIGMKNIQHTKLETHGG